MKQRTKQVIVGILAVLMVLTAVAGAVGPTLTEQPVQQEQNWGNS